MGLSLGASKCVARLFSFRASMSMLSGVLRFYVSGLLEVIFFGLGRLGLENDKHIVRVLVF